MVTRLLLFVGLRMQVKHACSNVFLYFAFIVFNVICQLFTTLLVEEQIGVRSRNTKTSKYVLQFSQSKVESKKCLENMESVGLSAEY